MPAPARPDVYRPRAGRTDGWPIASAVGDPNAAPEQPDPSFPDELIAIAFSAVPLEFSASPEYDHS